VFSTAGMTGSYAFAMSGWESGGRMSAVGWISLDGAGNLTAAVDSNDAGTVNSSSFSGNYSIADAVNGRGTLNDTTDGSHMALYVVSATEEFIIDIDTAGPPIFTGQALKQSGTFTNASLSGVSIAAFEGASSSGGYAALTLLTWTGSGSMSVLIDENDAGSITSQGSMSATYNVASTGRVSTTVSSGHAPILMLVSANKGFWLGTGGAIQTGFLEPQVGTNFTAASLSGNYFFGNEPLTATSSVETGVVTLPGNGTVSGTADHNDGTAVTSQSITDTLTVSGNGRVVLSDSVMYLISPSKAVMMQVSAGQNNPKVTVVEK